MAESTPRKLTLNRKSLALQALFALALLAVVRVFWLRQQPERLQVTAANDAPLSFIALTDRTCYLTRTAGYGLRANETAICALTLPGGDLHLIGKESSLYGIFSGRAGDNLISNGKLYYTATVRNVPAAPGKIDNDAVWGRRVGGNLGAQGILNAENAKGGRDLGTFRMPPAGLALATGQKCLSLTTQNVVPPGYRVRQMPLSGGSPQDAPVPAGNSLILQADHVFWIRPAAEQTAEIAQGETPRDRLRWKERTAQGDLMLTSLPDGATRCIRHGVYSNTKLVPGTAGVSWSEPALYPRAPNLFYARAADGRITALGQSDPGIDPPTCVELGERLYWTEMDHAAQSYTLMCAHLDGTDVHEIPGMTQQRRIGRLQLYGYQGSLYGCLQELSAGDREDYPVSLCRLHPDRSDPIEIVRKISGRGVAADAFNDFQFAGGYLYFQLTERPGFWAKLTRADVQRALYRVPLPP